jgi:hypothetical protein
MNKYVKRLYDEWVQHGKIIIAVDFDDTISPWKLNTEKDILETEIVKILRTCIETGAYIVCFTACNIDRFPEIERKFQELGLKLDKINENPINLPYGKHKKLYANIFLDDRAGLEESLKILDEALWKYKGYLASKRLDMLDDIA